MEDTAYLRSRQYMEAVIRQKLHGILVLSDCSVVLLTSMLLLLELLDRPTNFLHKKKTAILTATTGRNSFYVPVGH